MSDLISQFGRQPQTLFTNIGQGLRGLGGQLINREHQKRANEAYTNALSTYMEDNSEENLLGLYEAAAPVGKFDNIKTTVAEMNSMQQKNQLQNNMEKYSLINSGNIDMAIEKYEADAQAYENDGDINEAKQMSNFAQQLREGKTKEVLTHVGAMSGLLGLGGLGVDLATSGFF